MKIWIYHINIFRGTENSVDEEVVMAGPSTEIDDIDSELEQIQDTRDRP